MIIKTIYENARRKSRKDSRNRTEENQVSSAFSGRKENLETREVLVRGVVMKQKAREYGRKANRTIAVKDSPEKKV